MQKRSMTGPSVEYNYEMIFNVFFLNIFALQIRFICNFVKTIESVQHLTAEAFIKKVISSSSSTMFN